MGHDYEFSWRDDPVHRVRLDGFYIGKYLVTQALWKAVMGPENNPSFFQGDQRPVEQVSWNDCQEFIRQLNKYSGRLYRLPREAEWEYAARGGFRSQNFLYSGSLKLEEVAWFNDNSDKETKDVGRKKPNELGIYDMSGNVYEWCQDWHSRSYYNACHRRGVVENPIGPDTGAYRIIRGGSWSDDLGEHFQSINRYFDLPKLRRSYISFRLVLSPNKL